MKTQTSLQSPEEAVIGIMRKLPRDRALQILDFAHFLEIQTTNKKTKKEEEIEEIYDKKWDRLFRKPKAKEIMRKMAYEAQKDYCNGRTTNITITKDGRLAPA